MADASLRSTSSPRALTIEGVELVAGPDECLLVRVTGRWNDGVAGAPGPMQLAVPNGAGVLHFPAQAAPPGRGSSDQGADAGGLVATFSLPEALLPALAGELGLELADGSSVPLPPIGPSGRRDPEPPSGQVVDRDVLAERRARRAELGEQASARRAAAAEQATEALRTELGGLKDRLERVNAERAEADARVQDRDRSLRAAVQRLHAEQRRRENAWEEAARRVEAAEAEAQAARRRVAQAERDRGQLGEQVEELRRRAGEAENGLGAAVRARHRAEAEVAAATARLQTFAAARDHALSAQGRLAATVAGSGVLEREVAALRGTLDARPDNPTPASPLPAGALAACLAAERRQRGSALTARALEAGGGGGALNDADQVLAQARATIAQARRRLDELERARAGESGRAQAERAARVAVEAELDRARSAAAAAERAIGDLRGDLEQRVAVEARAQALMDQLHEQVRALHAETDERGRREEADRRLLAEWLAGARHALEDAEARIADALAAAGQAEAELERERQLRSGVERALEEEVARRWEAEQAVADRAEAGAGAEARLRRQLDRAAEAGQALQRRVDALEDALQAQRTQALELLVEEREAAAAAEASRAELQAELERRAAAQARAEWRGDELGAELVALRAQLAGPGASEPDGLAEPWLARGLRVMARQDPAAAVPLLLGLLATQDGASKGRVDYDLDLAGCGLYGVSLVEEGAKVVPLGAPRAAAEVAFRLALDAPALVELLRHGGSARLRRAAGIRVLGTRRRRRALRALRPVAFDPSDLAGRGVWLEPRLCFAALTLLMDPAWTRGHRFAVAQEVEGEPPWYVRIDDGVPPRVTTVAPPDGPAATVQMSRACFQRLLGGDASAGEKAAVRGDVRAIGLLAQWVARASGSAAPTSS